MSDISNIFTLGSMVNYYNTFAELHDNDDIDTDKIYGLLSSINYEELDYTNENHITMLFMYIRMRIEYCYFDNDDLMNLLKINSEILYYEIMIRLPVYKIQYYNDKILSIVPKYKIEILLQVAIKNIMLDGNLMDDNQKNSIKDKISRQLSSIIGDDRVLKQFIMDRFSMVFIDDLNDNEPLENIKNINNLANHVLRNSTLFKYNIIAKLLGRICKSHMSSYYVMYKTLECNIFTNNEFYIPPAQIIESIENRYNYRYTKNKDIELGLKCYILQNLTNILIRSIDNIHKQEYTAYIQHYYDTVILEFDPIKHSHIVNTLNKNYYSYFITESTTTIEKKTECCNAITLILENDINIGYFSVSSIIDLLSIYDYAKRYNDIITIYNKYKPYLKRIKNEILLVRLYNAIIPALINNHQLQTIKEFNFVILPTFNNISIINRIIERFNRIEKK